MNHVVEYGLSKGLILVDVAHFVKLVISISCIEKILLIESRCIVWVLAAVTPPCKAISSRTQIRRRLGFAADRHLTLLKVRYVVRDYVHLKLVSFARQE